MTDLEFITDVLPSWPINCLYELNAWTGTALIMWRYCGFIARAQFWLSLIDHLDAAHPTSINLTVDVPLGTRWLREPGISYEVRRDLGVSVHRYHVATSMRTGGTRDVAERHLARCGIFADNLAPASEAAAG